jgi:HAD superfamily hydrolase (TIGR01509 family)
VRPRAVIFDAGHTLLEFDYTRLVAELSTCGHDVTRAAVATAEQIARRRLDEERGAAGVRTRTGEGRYIKYLLEHLGIRDEATAKTIAEWRRGFNLPVGLCHQADPEALAAVRAVREAGLAVGVISNSNGSVAVALDRAGLGAHLDFVIDSTVVGVAKPDPRAFQLGLDAAGVAAGDAVYVGDSYHVDVVGARAVGMRGVLFDPGACWGARDCPVAAGLRAAVDLALDRGETR